MDADSWQRLGALLATLVAIGWGAIQARSARKEANVAVVHAEQAVQNTLPISNGFAGRIDDKLDVLLERSARLEQWQEDHDKRHERESFADFRRGRG